MTENARAFETGDRIPAQRLYGLMAEFINPEDVIRAAERVYREGYREVDAFTPFPVEGLPEAIGEHSNILPLLILGGGIAGAVAGFAMQYYATVISFPLNVGGRPLNSWPAYIPITFELAILTAAFAAILGMFYLNGLPQPYHPVFNVPDFDMASRDRFFIVIEAKDPKFDREQTKQFLKGLGANRVMEVEV